MPEVFMPRLSDTMEEGAINSWHKQVGDQVHKGDVLAEIETDKALMELEAYDDGVLTEILVPAGDSAPIGAPIAVIGQAAEAAGNGYPAAAPHAADDVALTGVQAPSLQQSALPAPAPVPAESVPQTPAAPAPAKPTPAAPPPASPLARTIARQHGLELAEIPGTGPGGRILRADIEAAVARRAQPPTPAAPTPSAASQASATAQVRPPQAAAGQPAAADDEEVPLSRVRRLTAERLARSAQQAPHFHLTRTVDADALLAFRQQANADLDGTGVRISVTDLLVKSCAHALSRHPEVNCSWADTKLLRHRRVSIGVAVAIDEGLVVPVIHDADRKTLTEISREAHDLAERARAGRLSLDEITGGTFTISNLGMYGVDRFTAVINPPDAAILAVG
ncbi:MAG TPA: dihydrolipoamide acetyltransferase family protein, partial [Actinocrinis sp.]|nr:dihydrolipoamide acetyltransferase family protein [Actinocrinis sp.]